MAKEPAAIFDGGNVSVYLYIVDTAGNAFAWEVVECRPRANEIFERKLVSEVEYLSYEEAEEAGKLKAAAVAKGMV